MLLMNKSGRIYDVPEQVAEEYIATGRNVSREAVEEMLNTFRNRSSISADSVEAAGCCNAFANYCPNT